MKKGSPDEGDDDKASLKEAMGVIGSNEPVVFPSCRESGRSLRFLG